MLPASQAKQSKPVLVRGDDLPLRNSRSGRNSAAHEATEARHSPPVAKPYVPGIQRGTKRKIQQALAAQPTIRQAFEKQTILPTSPRPMFFAKRTLSSPDSKRPRESIVESSDSKSGSLMSSSSSSKRGTPKAAAAKEPTSDLAISSSSSSSSSCYSKSTAKPADLRASRSSSSKQSKAKPVEDSSSSSETESDSSSSKSKRTKAKPAAISKASSSSSKQRTVKRATDSSSSSDTESENSASGSDSESGAAGNSSEDDTDGDEQPRKKCRYVGDMADRRKSKHVPVERWRVCFNSFPIRQRGWVRWRCLDCKYKDHLACDTCSVTCHENHDLVEDDDPSTICDCGLDPRCICIGTRNFGKEDLKARTVGRSFRDVMANTARRERLALFEGGSTTSYFTREQKAAALADLMLRQAAKQQNGGVFTKAFWHDFREQIHLDYLNQLDSPQPPNSAFPRLPTWDVGSAFSIKYGNVCIYRPRPPRLPDHDRSSAFSPMDMQEDSSESSSSSDSETSSSDDSADNSQADDSSESSQSESDCDDQELKDRERLTAQLLACQPAVPMEVDSEENAPSLVVLLPDGNQVNCDDAAASNALLGLAASAPASSHLNNDTDETEWISPPTSASSRAAS